MAGTTGLPTGTVTFLFSVIEDAPALLAELGQDGYATLLAEHNAVLDTSFGEHGGQAVDRRADIVFYAFPSAGGAVSGAAAAQLALGSGSRTGIGIHTGEATLGDEGYVGFAVHQASRIAGLAGSGQVLLSQTTASLVEAELDPELELRSIGPTLLPGFDRPEPIFQVIGQGLREGPMRTQTFELITEPKRSARIGIELGRCLMRGNRHNEAIDAFRRARERLGDGDPDLRESISSEVINAAWWDPELVDVAVAELEHVDESALGGGVGSDLLRATLGYWETRRGENRERALALARSAIAPQRIDLLGTRALHLATYTLTMAGYPDESLAVYDRVLRGAYARGDNILAASSTLFHAYTQLRRGDLEGAEADLVRFSELLANETTQLYSHAFRAELAMEKGDLETAEACIAESGLPETLSANGHLTFFQLARGRLRLEQHRHEDAIRELRSLAANVETLQIENSAFYDWRPFLVLALQAAGRRDEALPLAHEAVDRARSWGAPQSLGLALRTLGLVEGGVTGDALLREAVEVLRDSQWRLEYAKALVDLGAALRRGNKRSDSREYLRLGLELAHKLGATALEERAQTELAATGARPRRLMLSGLESLTPSERRVAGLAADNLTNKDIAQALFVTPKTVEVHLSSVYRKLEISSRSQLPDALGVAG